MQVAGHDKCPSFFEMVNPRSSRGFIFPRLTRECYRAAFGCVDNIGMTAFNRESRTALIVSEGDIILSGGVKSYNGGRMRHFSESSGGNRIFGHERKGNHVQPLIQRRNEDCREWRCFP